MRFILKISLKKNWGDIWVPIFSCILTLKASNTIGYLPRAATRDREEKDIPVPPNSVRS
jgi:hypothetical protein